jgi:hypothetical protein
MVLTYNANGVPLYVKAKPHIKYADVLLDVGAGIRPQSFVEWRRHVCLEPHGEYCEVLRANGFEVIQGEAPAALMSMDPVDTVACIDVLEHMTRDDGMAAVEQMKRLARGQVVIFTPLGFMPQDGGSDMDPWGYQGQRWQQHRSGWTPDDFPGWRCFVDDDFHTRERGAKYGAFFTIWDR